MKDRRGAEKGSERVESGRHGLVRVVLYKG